MIARMASRHEYERHPWSRASMRNGPHRKQNSRRLAAVSQRGTCPLAGRNRNKPRVFESTYCCKPTPVCRSPGGPNHDPRFYAKRVCFSYQHFGSWFFPVREKLSSSVSRSSSAQADCGVEGRPNSQNRLIAPLLLVQAAQPFVCVARVITSDIFRRFCGDGSVTRRK
jgi:hypothetical protein